MVICPFVPYGLAHGPKNLSYLPQIGSRRYGTHISETAGWMDGLVRTCSSACHGYLSICNTLSNQAVTLRNPYLLNRWMIYTIWVLWNCQGQILKMLYLRNGRAVKFLLYMERNGCESKGCYTNFVTFNFDLNHNLKFWKSRISGIRWPIDMEWKGCESIEFWTHVVTFNIHLTHDLHLGCSRSNFEKKLYLRNGMADWHGTKGMWVDRILDPCRGFQHSPHPWPWHWVFKVKFWKCCISGMGWLIDMERKGCESIGCYTHFVTFNFDINHDLDLEFWSQILKKSYLRNGMADWHGTKGMWVDITLDPCCDFQRLPQPWPWPWIFKVKFFNSYR